MTNTAFLAQSIAAILNGASIDTASPRHPDTYIITAKGNAAQGRHSARAPAAAAK
jgi:hypothetical protein